MQIWIEKDCTVEHEGRKYESGGAMINPDYLIAYLGKDGVLTDWHGNPIGTYKITATWKTPRSFVSSTMNQVRAYVKGIAYTGRSAGVGMVFNGKRAAKQERKG